MTKVERKKRGSLFLPAENQEGPSLWPGEEKMNPDLLIFLNRLSDFLFVLARFENHEGGGEEVIWTG